MKLRDLYFAPIVVALLTGCQTSVPFDHQIISVIPDNLKGKGAYAKAYAVNDAGHVVGVYSPPPPGNGPQIFVLAYGRLIRQESPCRNGYVYANIITNTGLIAGHCQSSETGQIHSFVFSYHQDGVLQAVQPAWPTTGYFISGMNDRGDAIGWAPEDLRREPDDVMGFIYVSGKLSVIRKSNSPQMASFGNAVLTGSGLVIGGSRDRMPAGPGRAIEYQYFVFENGRFAELPSDMWGSVKAANRKGQFVIKRQARSFGIKEENYREIDCGKEWCSVDDINDQGWVAGYRHTTYPIPPIGAAIGDAFLWTNRKFYSIDKSAGMKVDPESPLKLSNEGHVLFHSRYWPYLLAPQGLARRPDPSPH